MNPTKNTHNKRVAFLAFAAIFCLLCALAFVNEGRVFGYSLGNESSDSKETVTPTSKHEIINTAIPGKNISGYAGPVPLEIHITDGKIDSIHALPNSETPGFFSRLEKEGLTKAWNGLTLKEAANLKVDAVSGATYSSDAYISNVRAGVAYALESDTNGVEGVPEVRAVNVVAFIVLLCGAIIPIFTHDRRYRIVQQLANAGILGFWSGTFIDYAMMMNFFSNGLNLTLASLISLLLLAVGLCYPLFGKEQHYCNWICPYGSLQDLAGHITKRKIHLRPGLIKILDTFRKILWVVLISLLFAGWGAEWIHYEIFTAFIVESASWIVIAIGGAFIILSIFIPRPFCRFVCPTGSLLKML